jgi:hypothetical protein
MAGKADNKCTSISKLLITNKIDDDILYDLGRKDRKVKAESWELISGNCAFPENCLELFGILSRTSCFDGIS